MRLFKRPKHRAEYDWYRHIKLDLYARIRHEAYKSGNNRLLKAVWVFFVRPSTPRLAPLLYTKRVRKFGNETKRGS